MASNTWPNNGAEQLPAPRATIKLADDQLTVDHKVEKAFSNAAPNRPLYALERAALCCGLLIKL